MSNTEPNPAQCPKCGAPLTGDAVGGLCPRCLMAVNLATETAVPGEPESHGTKVISPPPAPAEIAALFPQLEIIECLGRGGMGVVYRARQPKLNRLVALKLLAPEKGADSKFAERFTREAQALARLSHQNIVTVYDFGEAGGHCYLLMEFVDGLSLRQLLQSRKLAPEEALAIVPRICEALQYAHDQGIVHRDIKPENILIDKQGRVKIADFGIAKLLGGETQRPPLTEERSVIGTPHYMAPEQIEHPLQVDHRADIYSLGVVFYEMLTGELPLGKFAPPSRKVEVDVRLDEVVLHALEKEPARRYQHASEVKTDVETIAQAQPAMASPPAADAGVASSFPLAEVCRQVRGPATGLVVTAILNWLAIPLIFLVTLWATSRHGADNNWLILVPLSALVLSSAMLAAGLKMKRLEAYGLAITGSILAILVSPGNLVGLPVGIWALVVLSRREVREMFGKGHPPPRLEPASTNRGGGAWKVAAVVAAAVMLLLAIPISLLLLAIAIPNFTSARHAQTAAATNDFVLVLHDNAGLDLDTGAVREARGEIDPYLDIGWDNDGGGALIKNPSGWARILALPDAKDFEDAAGKALSRVSLVRNSGERGNFASQYRFFAVLTDRDNLAVVEVTDYSETQATIRWRFLLGPKVRRTGFATAVR